MIAAVIVLATTIMLSGDVMLGRGIDQIQRHSVAPVIYEDYIKSAQGYVALAEEKNGPIPRRVRPDYVWGDALPILDQQKPQARIVNLETAVTTASDPWPNKGIHYRMHPANVDILKAAHIDCAVVSNNHVLDWGRAGLDETLHALHAAGVKTAGAGANAAEAAAPAITDVPGGRVLVFAMADQTAGVPPDWTALPSRSGVHLLPDLSAKTADQIANTIRSWPRREGDRVIASIHWGGNWGYEITRDQERFAHTLIDRGGVDIVHGHSSHHPQRIEIYRGHLILYGAGDLINDYEGIGGYQEFRPELSLIYFPALRPDGTLESLTLASFHMARFRLNRATEEETRWLRDRTQREARGLTFEITRGLIVARPK